MNVKESLPNVVAALIRKSHKREFAVALMVVGAFALFAAAPAGGQSPFEAATPVPTPIPGGAAAIGQTPAAAPTRGAGSPGLVQKPLTILFNVGEHTVFPPDNDCAGLIRQALEQRALVPLPASDRPERDKRCAEEMKHALQLEQTEPLCASGPCW